MVEVKEGGRLSTYLRIVDAVGGLEAGGLGEGSGS